MKPKVFACYAAPNCQNLRVGIGVSDCQWVLGGLGTACGGWVATVCQAAKLMCKYFHKFIFYSAKFWVSCLKTYKKFPQLIWASRQKLYFPQSRTLLPTWVWNLIFAACETFLRVRSVYFKNVFISLQICYAIKKDVINLVLFIWKQIKKHILKFGEYKKHFYVFPAAAILPKKNY